MSQLEGETAKNAAIGALVTTVAYLLGPLAVIAPVFGGFIAGYLEHHGATGGLKAGGAKGLVMTVPAIGLGIIASGLLAQVPIIGGLLGGGLIIVVLFIVAHSVALGAVSGLFGGMLSGGPSGKGTDETAETAV